MGYTDSRVTMNGGNYIHRNSNSFQLPNLAKIKSVK